MFAEFAVHICSCCCCLLQLLIRLIRLMLMHMFIYRKSIGVERQLDNSRVRCCAGAGEGTDARAYDFDRMRLVPVCACCGRRYKKAQEILFGDNLAFNARFGVKGEQEKGSIVLQKVFEIYQERLNRWQACRHA